MLNLNEVRAKDAERFELSVLTTAFINQGGVIEELPAVGVKGKDAYTGIAAQLPGKYKGWARPVYQGEEISWRELGKRTGINENCIRARMTNKCMTLEEAIAMGPPRGSKQ